VSSSRLKERCEGRKVGGMSVLLTERQVLEEEEEGGWGEQTKGGGQEAQRRRRLVLRLLFVTWRWKRGSG